MHWSCRVWLGPGKLGRPLGECPMLPAQASVLCFFMWTSQKGEKEERGRVGTTSGPLRKEGNSIVYPPTLKYDKTHIMTQKIESRFRSTSWAQPAACPGHSLLQPYLCTALSQTILQHHQDLRRLRAVWLLAPIVQRSKLRHRLEKGFVARMRLHKSWGQK